MLIYQVTLEVDPSIENEFVEWMLPHIKEVVEIGNFDSAEWFALENPINTVKSWTILYRTANEQVLEKYLANHSPKLREEGVNLFGEKLKTSRQILKTMGKIKKS
jgi:hypothetical protein